MYVLTTWNFSEDQGSEVVFSVGRILRSRDTDEKTFFIPLQKFLLNAGQLTDKVAKGLVQFTHITD